LGNQRPLPRYAAGFSAALGDYMRAILPTGESAEVPQIQRSAAKSVAAMNQSAQQDQISLADLLAVKNTQLAKAMDGAALLQTQVIALQRQVQERDERIAVLEAASLTPRIAI
jgi:hypothetical protein